MRMEDEVGVCNLTRADRSLPQVCGHPRRLSPGCQGSSSRFYPSSCRSCRWDQSVWEIVASPASALDVAVESRWTDKKERGRWTTDDKVEDCSSVLTRRAQGSLARSLLLSVHLCVYVHCLQPVVKSAARTSSQCATLTVCSCSNKPTCIDYNIFMRSEKIKPATKMCSILKW